MALARHGDSPHAAISALASQIHPVFMLPPLAASGFGGILAGRGAPAGGLHLAAIFCAVYTAHVKDGYVDFYFRNEDADHPLTARGCRLALLGASGLFFGLLGGLWWLVDIGAVLVTLPAWLIGYHHAPQLDTNPVTATTGYPLGIAVALAGGYYVQAGTLAPTVLAFAVVFLVLLSGIKIIDDAQDYAYDRSITKRTVAVALGVEDAHRLAYGLMAVALVAVIGFAAVGIFPVSAIAVSVLFASVAMIAWRADPERATMLLVRGSYVFLAVLVAAVWFRPMS